MMPSYIEVDEFRREFLKDNIIASTAVWVSRLMKLGALIEGEALAVLDESTK